MANAAVRRWFEHGPAKEQNRALQALWWAGSGDWEKAHAVAQEVATPDGAWAHAWLHRMEGDWANAGYWYRHAGRAMPPGDTAFDEEWERMVAEM